MNEVDSTWLQRAERCRIDVGDEHRFDAARDLDYATISRRCYLRRLLVYTRDVDGANGHELARQSKTLQFSLCTFRKTRRQTARVSALTSETLSSPPSSLCVLSASFCVVRVLAVACDRQPPHTGNLTSGLTKMHTKVFILTRTMNSYSAIINRKYILVISAEPKVLLFPGRYTKVLAFMRVLISSRLRP